MNASVMRDSIRCPNCGSRAAETAWHEDCVDTLHLPVTVVTAHWHHTCMDCRHEWRDSWRVGRAMARAIRRAMANTARERVMR